jgi:hypothetical protein
MVSVAFTYRLVTRAKERREEKRWETTYRLSRERSFPAHTSSVHHHDSDGNSADSRLTPLSDQVTRGHKGTSGSIAIADILRREIVLLERAATPEKIRSRQVRCTLGGRGRRAKPCPGSIGGDNGRTRTSKVPRVEQERL